MTHDFFDREMYEAWALESKVEFPRLYGSGVQHVEWGPISVGDRVFCAYDIVDVDADERLAWALVVYRRGELHVDDFFVKPDFRRRGFGSKMFDSLNRLSQTLHQPLRFWIPFPDVESPEKFDSLLKFFSSRGFHLEVSPRRWAAYFAVSGKSTELLPPIKLPPKAAYTFARSSEAQTERSRSAASQPEPYQQFIHRLAGSFGDEPFERPPQGDFEQREEW